MPERIDLGNIDRPEEPIQPDLADSVQLEPTGASRMSEEVFYVEQIRRDRNPRKGESYAPKTLWRFISVPDDPNFLPTVGDRVILFNDVVDANSSLVNGDLWKEKLEVIKYVGEISRTAEVIKFYGKYDITPPTEPEHLEGRILIYRPTDIQGLYKGQSAKPRGTPSEIDEDFDKIMDEEFPDKD